jgi:hypothetical protein
MSPEMQRVEAEIGTVTDIVAAMLTHVFPDGADAGKLVHQLRKSSLEHAERCEPAKKIDMECLLTTALHLGVMVAANRAVMILLTNEAFKNNKGDGA